MPFKESLTKEIVDTLLHETPLLQQPPYTVCRPPVAAPLCSDL